MSLAARPTRPSRPTPLGAWSRVLDEAAATHCPAVPFFFAPVTSTGLQNAILPHKCCRHQGQGRINRETAGAACGSGGGICCQCSYT